MKDAQAWRATFGVLGPSTNTIVQPDFEALRVPGVTNHYSRIFTPDSDAISNETFYAGTQIIAGNVIDAVKSVMTAKMDYLVMGMSAVTFYGGMDGAKKFEKEVTDVAGVGLSCGSLACDAALKAYGGIKRIAFVSPYYPVANEQVSNFFTDCGYEVVRDVCLQCPSWTAIAQVPEDRLRHVLRDELNGDDVDAIIQVGTNLSMIGLAAEAEKWLEKPVIAINTATYWHALRTNGMQDKVYGYGRLMAEF